MGETRRQISGQTSKPIMHPEATAVTRRSLLHAGLTAAGMAGLPASAIALQTPHKRAESSFLQLLRIPDRVTAFADLQQPLRLESSAGGESWRGGGVEVETSVSDHSVDIVIAAPRMELRYVHLRWQRKVSPDFLVLGDAWERSYGDLGWRSLVPERVLPWYFATLDRSSTGTFHCYGVKTGAGALCFWQVDAEGVSLWLNTSNGGSGVQLGTRRLQAATIVVRQSTREETQTDALADFCRQMCSRPSRPMLPMYGTNDWYYAYGKNSAAQTMRDAEYAASLAGSNRVRPFVVIDDGWADAATGDRSPLFPDMAGLAADLGKQTVRPGIWIRPLIAPTTTNPAWLLPGLRFGKRQERAGEVAVDPTVPEGRALAVAKVKQVAAWGYELIKHDFSTYELLGQWGFEMGADPTLPGWSLHDRTRTNAEVIIDLYSGIREAAGPDKLILGCNTIGHLGQGLFDASRTGDDTSGRVWERTRRMGVNTLAFRLPQHGTFFVQDADCVGITAGIPWEKNRQWMDVLAKSGTALFLSPGEGARSPEVMSAIRDAFEVAAANGTGLRPMDCRASSTPSTWTSVARPGNASDDPARYDWYLPDGADPFTV